MNLPELHLLRPAWLLALLPLAFALWRMSRRNTGTTAWRGLVDAHLLPHLLVGEAGPVRWLPLLLLSLGGLIGIVALAGPVWERLPQPAYRAQAERVIVLDLSPTMNATDIAPSRLAHARFEILDLLHRFREGQTGLIAYGAEPYVVSPLTADANTIAAQVPSLSTDLLPVQGPKRTGLALGEAGRLLSQAGSTRGHVILLTDALDNPAAALDAARALRKQGYRLSVLGLGTASGATVPVPGGGFLKDGDGAILMPKLDSTALQSLAGTGGGRYVTATLDDRDIEALAGDESGERQQAIADESTLADQWREEGPWLLLALLPLAAVAFRRGWIAPLLLVVLLAPPPPAAAFSWPDLWLRPDQQATRLLEQGDAQQAAQAFRQPDWRAAASYAAGDYQHALDALEGMDNPNAWYNRGNTLARLGSYPEAIAQYDRVLAKHPDDADARHNRDLVKQLLEQQQQSRQQQSQQGKSQQGESQQGQSQQGESQQGESQQGESQQGKSQQGDSQQGESGNGRDSASPGGTAQQQGQSGGQEPSGQQDAAQTPDHAPSPPTADQAGGQRDQDTPSAAGQNARDAAGTENADARAAQAQPETGEQGTAAPAQTAAAGNAGGSEPPPETQHVEPQAADTGAPTDRAASGNQTAQGGAEPGLADLLGTPRGPGTQTQTAAAAPPLPKTEAQQALEHQLNRVPDDPAGLLRQRFLLQHLRRNGQL